MDKEMKKPDLNKDDYEIDTLTNDRLIKDHEYDGIRELDNDLPVWLKWMFYLGITIAIVYSIRLFVFKAPDLIQADEYQKEMADFANNNTVAAENAAPFQVKLLTDAASLAKGRETWTKICAACHMADGGGLVGPNMTDNYWIHGNTVQDLYQVVTNGVIQKGMLSYKDQLSDESRLEVVSYVLEKLHGTKPAHPKAPQGKKYE